MSKAYEALRAIGIYNPHNAVSFAVERGYDGPAIFVTYRAEQRGRASRSAAQQVIGVGFSTNPVQGHWTDGGHKSFFPWSVTPKGSRPAMLAAALEWATAAYEVTEWVKIPGLGGSWFPKPVADIVKTALKGAKS